MLICSSQFERGKALSKIQDTVEVMLKEEGDEKSLKILPLAFDQVRKEVSVIVCA
jgi:hypothetical protein